MTTMKDIGEEMLKVQRQITFLKCKGRKTKEDIEELFILNRYYNILFANYMSKSI